MKYDSIKTTKDLAYDLFEDPVFYKKLSSCTIAILKNFDNNINRLLILLCEYNVPVYEHLEIIHHFKELFYKKYSELGKITNEHGIEYIEIIETGEIIKISPNLFKFL